MLCWIFFVPLFRVRVFGRQNLPAAGGAVIASNHQSFFDPVLIGVGLGREVDYMARASLFRSPLFRRLIKSLNAFPIKREGVDVEAMREAIARIRRGRLVLVFPEGTRTRDGSLGAVRRGLSLISERAQAPVVPAVIQGAYQAWPRGARMIRPHRIGVAFGRPISVEEQSRMTSEELAAVVADQWKTLRSSLAIYV
jgi:1-acyl-sn-glycerol-3-phosphate acyltransferase